MPENNDKSHSQTLQRKLDQANEKVRILENMIEERTRELYYKNANIHSQNMEMMQYLYIASHDLQEPLRTISSLVDALKYELREVTLSDDANVYMGGITTLTERMGTIIKDLLDYSRLGREKVLQKVDCQHIVQSVLEDLHTTIEAANAEVNIGILPVLTAYPTELKLLFQNLIGNAIKYRKTDVAPVIHIAAERGPTCWEFAISDNGIGIEEKYQEKIFMIFQRLHTRNKYDGNGIGLAHCKKIAELHEGKIWVESTIGVGSKFHFNIPDKINNT
ncbi:ATP-binding protein [Chitinophaga sp.]|uniref:sensor histidine kinase n=1 Tax=Chitinophaga sp. TaxID=1869181 RepID=UPI0031CE1659